MGFALGLSHRRRRRQDYSGFTSISPPLHSILRCSSLLPPRLQKSTSPVFESWRCVSGFGSSFVDAVARHGQDCEGLDSPSVGTKLQSRSRLFWRRRRIQKSHPCVNLLGGSVCAHGSFCSASSIGLRVSEDWITSPAK